QWMCAEHHIGDRDAVLHKTPLTFDVSVWELFAPLVGGARIVLAPPGAETDPRTLAEVIRTHSVTHAEFVPSVLEMLQAELGSNPVDSLREVLAGGEVLSGQLAACFTDASRAELFNTYGPAEATITVTRHRFE
ncbi:AMP-binding protein, partial [Nocardia sp. R7R-8]|uniref:AMP-binding protein n=1 Tax=Nocardia sp. R7R-8 TaxID=3459304 RepID=UPI00403D7792